MAMKKKAAVPEKISEEYYQISEEILSSFSKYRPPVDLFRFRDDIAQLYPLYRKGQRLSNEQAEDVLGLCREGALFVSRSDHPIYVEHIAKQADLVLVDDNLKESESADILLRALIMRLTAFFEQPVAAVFEPLYKDVMVFTEYLWQDLFRSRLFMRRLHTGDSDHVRHALNTMCVGTWILVQISSPEGMKRRQFDRTALGLLLHDAGMTKIPSYILQKGTPLKQEELEKVVAHPLAGIRMMQKLNLSFDELNQAIIQHHERLDGSGYPQKLRASAISQVGRLCAVADSFSAMITIRPYAAAREPLAAAQELADAQNRYDSLYAAPLLRAYQTNAFALPSAVPRQPEQ